MPVIAVVNRKGGSGKSTFATHVAAWCARQGHAVMLGDVDIQQSSRTWLNRRDPSLPRISPWIVDKRNVLRAPTGVTHVVLDTPGGMHGFELARVVMSADVVVMPVCPSIFDRESAAQCHAELKAMPRVASGRCRVATVGMRVNPNSAGADTLRRWSEGLGIPMLGLLRENQLYINSIERGQTLFDLPEGDVATEMQEWAPILDWLRPLLDAPPKQQGPGAANSRTLGNSVSPSLRPAQQSLAHGSRMSVLSGGRPLNPVERTNQAPAQPAAGPSHIPNFLKRFEK